MDEKRERLIDLVVATGAILIAILLVWQSLAHSEDARAIVRAEMRVLEQTGIVHDATLALPAETREAIGVDGAPALPQTPAAALSELDAQVIALATSDEVRLGWVALAVGWRQDTAARTRIAELASDPKRLEAHRGTLDELLRLANGKGAESLPSLQATMLGWGASRWLIGHVRERHLANIADPSAPAVAAENIAIATAAVSRWALTGAAELFLLPTIGLIALVLVPMFLRTRLLARGLAADLVPSPFRVERTWRVFFAWFVAFQVTGYVLVIAFSLLMTGTQLVALVMAVQALASTGLVFWLIDQWARLPRDERSAPVAIGLGGRGRVKVALLWLIPGIGIAMACVRAGDMLNLVLLGRPPEVQSVVQLVMDESSLPVMLLVGLGAVVLAPLAEEVVFRGFLFRNLRDATGKGLAMLLSGFAFALVHFEVTLILPLTALGVALALLYEWSGSLYVPIVVHALWNLLALIKIELWRI